MKKIIILFIFLILSSFLISCFQDEEANVGTLVVMNNSPTLDLNELYIVESGTVSWGANRITSPILDSTEYSGSTNNDTASFSLNSGSYNIKVVDENSTEYILDNVDLGDNRTVYFTGTSLIK